MKLLALLLALGCAGALAAVSLARPSATALVGTVGPGFSIKLTKDGQAVTHLDPGDYTITVHDLSVEHDFHLAGGGISKATSVEGTGDETWDVTLTTDSYVFFCDAHAATMLGKFTVGDVPVTTTTTAAPAPVVAHVKATAAHGTVKVTGTANHAAKLDVSLLRGKVRVGHKVGSGTAVTLTQKVKPGAYTTRVVATDANGKATATGKLVVR
jgi:hypothetical protein